MNKTGIEWVKNPDGTQGYTWNPITGCLNHVDGMCKGGGFPCYAYRLANGRLRNRYLANNHIAMPLTGIDLMEATRAYQDPFYPRWWGDRLARAFAELQNAKPRGIFVCDMSDLFGIGVPEEWTWVTLYTINKLPQHRFYLLTKQPHNLLKWSPFPDNCWVGVTFTNDRGMWDGMKDLIEVKAKVKYISFEPLLGNLTPLMWNLLASRPRYIQWLIIGAQTKPYKPPKIEWVQEIVEAADRAGIPVFLKDNMKPLLQQNKHNLYSFPEWAGIQFAVTGNRSLAPMNPHPNEAMRKLKQEMPEVKV